MKEKKFSTYQIVFVAVMAAIVCVVTFFRFPFLGSKVHFANAMCLLSGMLFGPVLGGLAAGLGSMLADLLSYPHYAPGTLVIKFTMAVAAAYIFEAMRERSGKLAAQLIGGAAAEIIMVLGYFGYASLWLGKGLAAAASIPGNLVQGVFGIAAGIAVYAVLDRSHVLARA